MFRRELEPAARRQTPLRELGRVRKTRARFPVWLGSGNFASAPDQAGSGPDGPTEAVGFTERPVCGEAADCRASRPEK